MPLRKGIFFFFNWDSLHARSELGEWIGGGVSLQAQTFELWTVGYYPTKKLSPSVLPLITKRILEKKVSLIACRQILAKILPAAYIFSNTIMTNLKKLIGNERLNTKQCPAGLSPKIIPLKLYGKPWGWGRVPANSQKFTHFPHQKNPP